MNLLHYDGTPVASPVPIYDPTIQSYGTEEPIVGLPDTGTGDMFGGYAAWSLLLAVIILGLMGCAIRYHVTRSR